MHMYNSNKSNNVINNYYSIMRIKVCFVFMRRYTRVFVKFDSTCDFIELKRDGYSK